MIKTANEQPCGTSLARNWQPSAETPNAEMLGKVLWSMPLPGTYPRSSGEAFRQLLEDLREGGTSMERFPYRFRHPNRSQRQQWNFAAFGGGRVHACLKFQAWLMLGATQDAKYEMAIYCDSCRFVADVVNKKTGVIAECGDTSADKIIEYLCLPWVKEVIVLPHYKKFGVATGFRFKREANEHRSVDLMQILQDATRSIQE